ncbi:hypothetical protein R3W88_000276 [Solanum pinnatisectum]|uniref:Uncharacterized protein n=1 Tax=Solanum pinnatisectum TaxID=50273 RepID=A0AAV9MHR7_9SOLN|nr:hypothetical protein R3W88_000276 [Solanum pinnatisectum]
MHKKEIRDVSIFDGLTIYVKELIAGGGAGAFAKTVIAPLERVKILKQTKTELFNFLGVYQSLKEDLEMRRRYLLAGLTVVETTVLCTYPLDLARTKLAYQVVDTKGHVKHHSYNGVKHVMQAVPRKRDSK